MERHQQQSGKVYMRFQTVHLYNPSNGWLQNCNSLHTQLLAQKVQEENYLPTWRLRKF
jgi:hypothetical protein